MSRMSFDSRSLSNSTVTLADEERMSKMFEDEQEVYKSICEYMSRYFNMDQIGSELVKDCAECCIDYLRYKGDPGVCGFAVMTNDDNTIHRVHFIDDPDMVDFYTETGWLVASLDDITGGYYD